MIPPHPGLNRSLRRLLDPLLRAAAATPGADRYRKHFSTHSHLQILLFHVLDGSASLRQTHAKLSGLGFETVGLTQPISRSQLARSSTSRPLAPVTQLFADLVTQARAKSARTSPPGGPIRLIDSSFLDLSAACSPWSTHGGHVPGVRIHTGFDLAEEIPSSLHLTLADTHDARALAETELAPLVGWTLVMDRGYYGHPQFAQLREAGVHFVVRFRDQAHVAVTADHPVPPSAGSDVVVSDQTVTLGSPHNHASVVVPEVRLITSVNQTGEPLRVVTDRFDLPAAVVLQLYRRRWRIELFFRWLKHHLGLLHPLGRSPQAIWLSVLLLACVAVLAMLLDSARPPAVTHIAFLRTLAMVLPFALRSG
jgi:DDE family transposase